MTNSVPASALLVAVTAPPCASTISFVIASPRPVLASARAPVGSAWKKRSKISGSAAGAITEPVLCTARRTCPSAAAERSATRAPAGVRQVLRPRRGAVDDGLGEALDRSEGRLQFVGDVGEEVAQRAVGAADLARHGVERLREAGGPPPAARAPARAGVVGAAPV